MIIGAFYLTEKVIGEPGEGRVFRSVYELERAYEAGDVSLHAEIEFRHPKLVATPANGKAATYTKTTVGRVFFNGALPDRFEFINDRVTKRQMGEIVDTLAEFYDKADVASSLDAIKNLCFRYATKSGLTVSIDDVQTPVEKKDILDRHEKEADKVESQFRRGIITDGERRQKEVEIWTTATDEVRVKMEEQLKARQFNPIDMMVGSGARGNMMQVRQIAGMRGLVANPRGDMIPRPIKSNFREGLTMLEYFIATPGARKGLVDTALRTADSGYLTRRLVDVAQELIINSEDPFSPGSDGKPRAVRGIWIEDVGPDVPGHRTWLETRLYSRVLADDVKLADGRVLSKGSTIEEAEMEALRDDPEVNRVQVLSPLTDDSDVGISAACYGLSLATGKTHRAGEAVGVIAAQSIGEPGTQLTMRTFHAGGMADVRHHRWAAPRGRAVRGAHVRRARPPAQPRLTASSTSTTSRARVDVVTVVADDGTAQEELHGARPGPPRGRRRPEVEAGDALVEGPKRPQGAARREGRCARRSSTSSRRSRRSTATRACRSTTSTSS